MLYVCVRGVMDVVFSVCIVTRGAVCARVMEIIVFRNADVVCLCVVCIMFSSQCCILNIVGERTPPWGMPVLN